MASAAVAILICTVLSVHDGDTLTVRCPEQSPEKIRLAEVDAPELHQAYGWEAGEVLRKLVDRREVGVEEVDTDRYGRTVAEIYLDGQPVQRQLLKAGAVWCYPRYARHDWCASDEIEARQARVGLWKADAPEAPWDFRHGTH